MKLSVLLIAFYVLLASSEWLMDFNKAQQEAAQNHKVILLNFSGSDWCIPCIRLRKDVFESPAFSAFADSALILANADFPRQKKNRLPEELVKQNDALAEKYNPTGLFPLTLLLTADGIIIKSWEGNPGLKADDFINEIRNACNSGK
jgi:thioredoxin-related protein